jgi:hypothetical protein
MKNGSARFDFFLTQLQTLITKSARQKNPALWLYQNNARTPLFMLEGLAKLYAGLHNKKKFSKIKEHLKLLEDGLGQIDHYDAFARQFAANKKIPAAATGYIKAQAQIKQQHLNEVLVSKDWSSQEKTRIDKIRKKLAEADWQDDAEEIKSIRDFYISSITGILEFIREKNFHFTDVEHDLHEMRRKIRWLSIYPHALRGCVQLGQSGKPPASLSKYLTKAITGSPYNTMPDAGGLRHFLLLDKNRFYALSWIIAELGNLKDNGLQAEALKEALLQTSPLSETQALAKATQYGGKTQLSPQQVLDKAENLLKTYCKEKNLESLIIGEASIKK